MTRVWLLLAFLLCALDSWAAGRVALVIGNDKYEAFAPLNPAVRDANRLADALESLPVPLALTRNT
jgi:hypothetical protein